MWATSFRVANIATGRERRGVQTTLYADARDADYEKNPAAYRITQKLVTRKTRMCVREARSGGFALSLTEATAADRRALKSAKVMTE